MPSIPTPSQINRKMHATPEPQAPLRDGVFRSIQRIDHGELGNTAAPHV